MARIEVTLEPVKVMYVEAEGGLSAIRQSWSKLESKRPSPKGRKFYGTYHVADKVYRACVAINDEKEPETLNLPTWTIPGGKYPREKITGWSSRPELMGETFESMAQESDPDPTHPSIEFYKSQQEVILLLPIL
jgi:DNA gyrase inhibitor GyrI